MLEAKNINKEATENKITVCENTFTRPYLSAISPKKIPPISIPKLVIVAIKPACAPLRPKVAIIEDNEKDKNIISIFSNAIPEAVENNTFR